MPALYRLRRVWDNAGRIAIVRGPVVYCAEAQDNGGVDLHTLYVSPAAAAGVNVLSAGPAGLPELELTARRLLPMPDDALYYPASESVFEDFRLRMIPYYAFANRGEDDMLIWFTCDGR